MIREAAILHRLALAVRRALLIPPWSSCLPAPAQAHTLATAATAVTASVAEPCPGDPIRIDQLTTGSFESNLQGGYVLVPFDVPAGTTAVRVKYCFDQPEVPTPNVRHTLDLGIYDPRGFRGWGGSSHPDVTLSPEGFSTEAEYLAKPKGHVPGKTTRGFRPGPIRPGRWSAESAWPRSPGASSATPTTAWPGASRSSTPSDPAFADRPYRKARYPSKPKRKKAGWYTGDLHVHAEHSALGDATMRETFDYAFRRAKLDFITLTDYVTDSAWARRPLQDRPSPRRPLLGGHPSAAHEQPDLRPLRRLPTGPVYDLRADGGVTLRRAAQPASRILRDVRRAGGFTRSTTQRSSRPRTRCSRCSAAAAVGLLRPRRRTTSWSTRSRSTRARRRSVRRRTRSTSTAIDFYEQALAAGAHAAALGSATRTGRAARTARASRRSASARPPSM